MKPFSRWRWIFQCACGLRHRKGESWFRVQRGKPPELVSRCSRCGTKSGAVSH